MKSVVDFMKTQNRQFDKRSGSALILVVVVTVLLAVVGVMFLMISRAGETQSGAVVQSKDLSAAVDTVVNRINDVLVDDLFGQKLANPSNLASWKRDEAMLNGGTAPVDKLNVFSDEPWDIPGHSGAGHATQSIDPGSNGEIDKTVAIGSNDDIWLPGQMDDYWLASLEPVYANWGPDGVSNTPDDEYMWPHITDLWGQLQGTTDSLYYQRFTPNDHIYYQNTRMQWIDPDRTDNAAHNYHGWGTSALWDKWQVSAYNVKTKVIQPKDRMDIIAVNVNSSGSFPAAWGNADPAHVNPFGARADADGDGVADSRWVQVPGLSTSRGEPVYAAVRIIDNCAMLNLNGAHCFYQEPYNQPSPRYIDDVTPKEPVSPFLKPWFYNAADYAGNVSYHNNTQGTGRYLTEINYLPFLRGSDNFASGDNWYNLMLARRLYKVNASGDPVPFSFLPRESHLYFMNVETPSPFYGFFNIGDELELRNRYMLTSPAEARFERTDAANYTLDANGGDYGCLETPVTTAADLFAWNIKINPENFDKWNSSGFIPSTANLYAFRYDRRHISTFYSFDRTLRDGQPPLSYNQLRTDFWTPQQIAATKQSIFWYPLLYSELKDAGRTPTQIVNAQRLFWPVGPVTTDIASPDELLKGTSGRPFNNVETRRRILHLLFAFREYFYQQNGNDLNKAALSAAQVVANLIDYADDYSVNDDNSGNQDGKVDSQGPFYSPPFSVAGNSIDYGRQANIDCTFITEQTIQNMIVEISGGTVAAGTLPFGLDTTDVVFGYERQPFISEVYARRNISGGLDAFAVELLNPYADALPLVRADASFSQNEDAWRIRTADGTVDQPIADVYFQIPAYNMDHQTPGRYVVSHSGSITLGSGPLVPATRFAVPALLNVQSTDTLQLLRPAPKWVKDNLGIQFVVVDEVSAADLTDLLGNNGENAKKRDDTKWRFVYPKYVLQKSEDSTYVNTLGQPNTITKTVPEEFQLAAANGQLSPARLHELETLSIHGGGKPDDPNSAITIKIADPNSIRFFDFAEDPNSAKALNYVCAMNRPHLGSLPGRININTAPVHVIAAAIPPTLIDPDVANGPIQPTAFSAQRLAQGIVNYRNMNGPYKKVSDLLNLPIFEKYVTTSPVDVGSKSIQDDIEERHWILSNLANKFTVRSDTFTAYILVRLGTDGPQRRMIAIFDRSQVWDMNDRPRLVALHPVPDPR